MVKRLACVRRVRLAAGLLAGLAGCALLLAAAESAPTTQTAPAAEARTPIKYTDVRVDITKLPERWYVRKPAQPPPTLPAAIERAFIIPIREEIRTSTYDAIVRKSAEARARGAQIIIFDMDTPGGASDAMDNIVELITRDLQDVYTVAYVNPQAFSAGAVISLACNEIVMVRDGVIGDAMPILISPGGVEAMPEMIRGKIESAARAIIRTLAERNGYNPALCEAMITMKMEVWLVRNRDTEELAIVDADKVRHLVAGAPGEEDAKMASRPATGPVYDYLLTIDTSGELVTMTASEAYRMGFTDRILNSMSELRKHYGMTTEPTVMIDTWSERLVAFLTSPVVTGLLMLVGILAIYAELHTPGFGLAGTVAIICFALLLGSRYLTGLAQWWEVALFVVGLILIGLEVFVIPGFGIAGILGILFCVAALLAMVVPNAPDKLPLPKTDLDWSIFASGAMALGFAFVGAIAGMIFLARFLPKVPVAGRLVLAPPAPSVAPPAAETAAIWALRPGEVGVVTATCRPAGVARFGETLVDVVSEGEFLSPGTTVTVLRNEGNRIVVTAVS